MVRPEWGTKRTCPSCEARFYDLHRNPIHCPRCSHTVESGILSRLQKLATRKTIKPAVTVPNPIEDIDIELPGIEEERDILTDIDDSEPETEGGESDLRREENDEEENDLIEDASDFGVDDDDMAEVMGRLEDEYDA